MIYCFDTHYTTESAKTSCVGIAKWSDEAIQFEKSEVLLGISDYESGAFYKRELPCILSLLKQMNLSEGNDVLVIDGFVFLDDNRKLGLGGHLYEALNGKFPVIGVAKNNFATIDNEKKEVYRGKSLKPLFITAAGMSLNEAHDHILSMHGEFRLPTILKQVDSLCRTV